MHHVHQEQSNTAESNELQMSSIRIQFSHEPIPPSIHPGRTNLPRAGETAAVFVSHDGAPPPNRSIAVYPHATNQLKILDKTSQWLDPLSYVLFCPNGEPGWNINMSHVQSRATRNQTKLTLQQFIGFYLAVRDPFNAIHLGGKLFQQYLVDYYCQIEDI